MKWAITTLFLALGIWPLFAHAATLAELEARLQTLEEEIRLINEHGDKLSDKVNQSMSVGGYTDATYAIDSQNTTKPSFHLHHLSLHFKQHINESWRFFSEFEFEDGPQFSAGDPITVLIDCGADTICGGTGSADDTTSTINTLSTSEGKIFTEAFNLDFTWRSYASFRIGRFFTPAGIWSIDHYPPFVATIERPRHIRNIFPQITDGAMLYGIAPIANHFVSYDLYTSNGEGNSAHEDSNSHKALGLRVNLDLPYLDNTNIGATYYHDILNDGTNKTAVGLHSELRLNHYEIQAEVADALLKQQPGNYHRRGYYLQGLYRFTRWTLGLRYDYYNADSRLAVDEITRTAFANYHITESMNLKLEHHIINNEDPGLVDHQKTIISISASLGQ